MPAIHHLALRTRDVETLSRFYERWFGLKIVRDALPHSLWLGFQGGVLMIELAAWDEPGIARGSLELLAFHGTPEERAVLRGQLVEEGRLEAETAHTLYFRDPDGRRVAVSSYPLADRIGA